MADSKGALPSLNRAIIGTDTVEHEAARKELTTYVSQYFPKLDEYKSKLTNIRNDEVGNFTIDFIAEIEKVSEIKALSKQLKSHIAAILFPPVKLEHDELMHFVRSSSNARIISVGSRHVTVVPPLNTNIYEILHKYYRSKLFLAKLADVDISVWYKYENAKAVPSATTWGLFLLRADIHPVYELVLRDDSESFQKSQFAKILTDYCQVRFTSTGNGDANDLRSLEELSNDFTAYEKVISDNVTSEKVLTRLKAAGISLEPLYSTLNLKVGDKVEKISKSDFKVFVDAIKNFVEAHIDKFPTSRFENTMNWERAILIAILESDVSESLIEEFENYTKHLSIANRMYIQPPNNPNVYTALKSALTSPGDSIAAFYKMIRVEIGMWTRLESGSRNLSSSVWSTILLILNLHPFYKLRVRKDVYNSVPGKFYVATHKVIVNDEKSSDQGKEQSLEPKTFTLIK